MKTLRHHIFFCSFIIFSFMLILPKDSFASVAMRLPQYVNEILLNNHSLRAGVKNVEAGYYSVLS